MDYFIKSNEILSGNEIEKLPNFLQKYVKWIYGKVDTARQIQPITSTTARQIQAITANNARQIQPTTSNISRQIQPTTSNIYTETSDNLINPTTSTSTSTRVITLQQYKPILRNVINQKLTANHNDFVKSKIIKAIDVFEFKNNIKIPNTKELIINSPNIKITLTDFETKINYDLTQIDNPQTAINLSTETLIKSLLNQLRDYLFNTTAYEITKRRSTPIINELEDDFIIPTRISITATQRSRRTISIIGTKNNRTSRDLSVD